jgi:hypothetical protein
MRIEPQKPSPELPQASRWNLLFMKRTNRLAIAMFLGGIVYFILTRYVFRTHR